MHGATASVDFYANVIAPYKGELEEWFVSNRSLYIYFVVIFVTAWAVLTPSTKIAWSIFKDLPKPPTELREALNYTD
jgi:cytochrome b561